MATTSLLEFTLLSPLGKLGRGVLAVVSYLGGVGTLALSALNGVFQRGEDDPPLIAAFLTQLGTFLALGIPLVGLAHVGMGSFLSMQAYFGGTFVEGTGAVVGVGLIRNVAPLISGMIMAGILAPLLTFELGGRKTLEPPTVTSRIPDRDAPAGHLLSRDVETTPGRLAAVRLLAAVIAGPILTLWAIFVGMVVGWQVSQELLGVSTHAYFYMLAEMLWFRDVLGVIGKGVIYGFFAGLFACYEGLILEANPAPDRAIRSAFRAACMALLAMLLINSGWFLLFYHAGPAFGPTLLEPPTT